MNRPLASLVGLAAAGALLVGVTDAGASSGRRTVHFSTTCTGRLSGETTGAGTCHSPQLGSYAYVTHERIPHYTETYMFKDGSKLFVDGTDKLGPAGATGTFRIVGGTRRFRGATGRGSGIAKLGANGTSSRFSGVISY